MKRPTLKRRLHELAAEAYSGILSLNQRQRRAALRALDKLTTTNCGWYLYEMRGVLRTFIDCATPRRPKKKKRKP